MNLRHKLILAFLAAALGPLLAILWMSVALLEPTLRFVATDDLDRLSKSLEGIAREYYRQSRDILKAESVSGKPEAQRYSVAARASWPASVQQFWESADEERYELSQPHGDRLSYMVRGDSEVRIYSRSLNGVRMEDIREQYRRARLQVENLRERNLLQGFTMALILLGTVIWILALVSVIYLANRISKPIEDLTDGLRRLAAGDFEIRLHPRPGDEIGRAIQAFNNTAGHLEQSRNRLVYLTQIASWRTLARKMAHELKNSLTPIRLTVEEILARQPAADSRFLEQATQVVVDEVESLQRRLRAFSEFAAEPAANPARLDLNAILEERVQFLLVAHPDVTYEVKLRPDLPAAWADADQVKGILTNLLENAAEAALAGGRILGVTSMVEGKIAVEVHDSGPGLSVEARRSLFEPSISFKKHGMGLGLSISRKNALLAEGDLQAMEGRLGGAGFRLILPIAPQ